MSRFAENRPLMSLSKEELNDFFDGLTPKRTINETLAKEKTTICIKRKEVIAFLPILTDVLLTFADSLKMAQRNSQPNSTEFYQILIENGNALSTLIMESDKHADLITIDLDYREFECFVTALEITNETLSFHGGASPILKALYDKWNSVFIERQKIVEA